MNLQGKNVVIVGGYGGIGFETSKEILKRDIANLVILDLKNNLEQYQLLKENFPKANIHFFRLDITKKSNIESCFKDIKKLINHFEVLINVSGVLDDRDAELTININLIGLINTNLIAVPYMSKAEGGKGGMIVNIASVLGLEPVAPYAVYTATKHGVLGFTRSLADDFYYQRNGVSFVSICPGLTTTSLTENFIGKETFPYADEASKHILQAKFQTAEQCGVSLVKAIEIAKNGSIWILDLGEINEVEPKKYWDITF